MGRKNIGANLSLRDRGFFATTKNAVTSVSKLGGATTDATGSRRTAINSDRRVKVSPGGSSNTVGGAAGGGSGDIRVVSTRPQDLAVGRRNRDGLLSAAGQRPPRQRSIVNDRSRRGS